MTSTLDDHRRTRRKQPSHDTERQRHDTERQRYACTSIVHHPHGVWRDERLSDRQPVNPLRQTGRTIQPHRSTSGLQRFRPGISTGRFGRTPARRTGALALIDDEPRVWTGTGRGASRCRPTSRGCPRFRAGTPAPRPRDPDSVEVTIAAEILAIGADRPRPARSESCELPGARCSHGHALRTRCESPTGPGFRSSPRPESARRKCRKPTDLPLSGGHRRRLTPCASTT